jgi:hypothetical protein
MKWIEFSLRRKLVDTGSIADVGANLSCIWKEFSLPSRYGSSSVHTQRRSESEGGELSDEAWPSGFEPLLEAQDRAAGPRSAHSLHLRFEVLIPKGPVGSMLGAPRRQPGLPQRTRSRTR